MYLGWNPPRSVRALFWLLMRWPYVLAGLTAIMIAAKVGCRYAGL